LKKNLALSKSKDKLRNSVELGNLRIPIKRQCQLLGINRSSYYYHPVPITDETIKLMNRIDEIYIDKPYYGYIKITKQLKREG
jgi:putative transposase